ncbi:MAG: Transcriptional regulator, AraC family protein [Deltaproteobacteria bacterium]|nr:Transcriptional regulator, AraC family protein [Deltaproteobacteria bacterium]
MMGRTVSTVFVRSTLLALGAAGVDCPALIAQLAIPHELLADPDARVSVELYHRLWREGSTLSSDPDFGLHAGERMPVGAFDVLDYLLRSSRDVGDAIANTMRYFRIMSEAAELALEVEADRACLRQRLVADEHGVPRHVGECFLSVIVARYRGVVGTTMPLRSVTFMHPRPTDTSEHRRIFGTEVLFDRDCNSLAFDAHLLAAPFATADPALNELLGRHAARLLHALPQSDGFPDRVRHAIGRAADAGEFSVTALATRLHLSRRTLQRKLGEHGLAAETMIDDTRRTLALRYLEEHKLAIAEVAALVGFSELSAFYRAFKRWTGTTPRRYASR